MYFTNYTYIPIEPRKRTRFPTGRSPSDIIVPLRKRGRFVVRATPVLSGTVYIHGFHTMHTRFVCCSLPFVFLLSSHMDLRGACVSVITRLIYKILKAHDPGHGPLSRKEIYYCWDPIKSSNPNTCWSTGAGGS